MTDPVLQFIPDLASTNQWLSQEAVEGFESQAPLAPFTAVFTDFQAQGRGMGSNQWFSERGKNILFSMYFPAKTTAARQFLFNQYFALATRQFLMDYLPEVDIKWPNDIYVCGHKLAGILIEHHLNGERLLYTIAGIGINVNQEDFPDNIPHPTSLFRETGRTFSIDQLTCHYWQTLQHAFESFDWKMDIAHNETYIRHLYQLDVWSEYLIHGIRCEAKIVGIDAYGQLRLLKRNNEEVLCGFKEIVFL